MKNLSFIGFVAQPTEELILMWWVGLHAHLQECFGEVEILMSVKYPPPTHPTNPILVL
jgi:hypothetical protein